jgi:hypothetical protein
MSAPPLRSKLPWRAHSRIKGVSRSRFGLSERTIKESVRGRTAKKRPGGNPVAIGQNWPAAVNSGTGTAPLIPQQNQQTGGEGGIRTLGPPQRGQRFSRPPRSTAPAPLRLSGGRDLAYRCREHQANENADWHPIGTRALAIRAAHGRIDCLRGSRVGFGRTGARRRRE